MYEPHIVKLKLQRAANIKSKNANLFAIYTSVQGRKVWKSERVYRATAHARGKLYQLQVK